MTKLSPALKLYLKAFDEHLKSGSQTSRDVMTAALYGHAGRRQLERNGSALSGRDALQNVIDGPREKKHDRVMTEEHKAKMAEGRRKSGMYGRA